jgi:hypothetical protein
MIEGYCNRNSMAEPFRTPAELQHVASLCRHRRERHPGTCLHWTTARLIEQAGRAPIGGLFAISAIVVIALVADLLGRGVLLALSLVVIFVMMGLLIEIEKRPGDEDERKERSSGDGG